MEIFAAASAAVVPMTAGGLFMTKYEPGSMTPLTRSFRIAHEQIVVSH